MDPSHSQTDSEIHKGNVVLRCHILKIYLGNSKKTYKYEMESLQTIMTNFFNTMEHRKCKMENRILICEWMNEGKNEILDFRYTAWCILDKSIWISKSKKLFSWFSHCTTTTFEKKYSSFLSNTRQQVGVRRKYKFSTQ